jgi:hypothetical protein
MKKISTIYNLVEYANFDNLKQNRTQTEDEYYINYNENGVRVELRETNSIIEDEYCLSLESAKYVVEGIKNTKKSMIHHHKKGHKFKHLQFKLYSKREEIRIFLDILDDEEYMRCIKGFLHIAQDLISHEKEESKINGDLLAYFFNEKIKTLEQERRYLLAKIGDAFSKNMITGTNDKPIDRERLLELKKETHLKSFFE